MKASEAREICRGKIQMTEDEVFRDIKRVSQWGNYCAVFAKNQISESIKKRLKKEGYRLIEHPDAVTVAWNE